MASDFIIDVSEDNFEFEVVNYSMQKPVVVDFWAPWCIPCRVLSPLLSRLTEEGDGLYRLARVNVDENPKLAERLKVRNVPSVKAFVEARIVAEFSGVLSEPNLREFFAHLVPVPGDLMLEKGKSLMLMGSWADAEQVLMEYLEFKPNHPGGLLALIKTLLMQGKEREAQLLLSNFPASHEYTAAERLRPVAKAFTWVTANADGNEDALEAAYRNSLRLAMRGNLLAALDGFLDILRRDKQYRQGEVKEVFIGLLELLGEQHPEVRQYRSELSNVLF
jgi:putative thioredoxin